MTIDLYVVREAPKVNAEDARASLSALERRISGLTFVVDRGSPGELSVEAYFGRLYQAGVMYVVPEDGDFEPDEAMEPDTLPHLVVSSDGRAWPWIQFIAVELAKELGGAVYDPQEGASFDSLMAEHTIEQLTAMHDAEVVANDLKLVASYYARVPTEVNDRALLERVLGVVAEAARTHLRVDVLMALGTRQVNVWQTIQLLDGQALTVSCTLGHDDMSRTLTVEAPPHDAAVSSFTADVEHALGIKFQRIDRLT